MIVKSIPFCTQAMQEKRKGRDKKQELDVEDWRLSRVYRTGRKALVCLHSFESINICSCKSVV